MWPQLEHTHVTSWAHQVVNALASLGIHTSVSALEAISNVLMFLPFGILGVAILWDLPRFRSVNTGLVGDIAKITLLAAGLSSLIEATQLVIPGRVTSFDDLWRNTLGALIGAAISGVYFAVRRRRHADAAAPVSFVRSP